MDAFLADTSPTAYEKAVDKLLASPRYGERWARLWLDVARYSDTKGYVFAEDGHTRMRILTAIGSSMRLITICPTTNF